MARKGKAVRNAKVAKESEVVEVEDVKPEIEDIKPGTLGEHDVVMGGDVVADVPQNLLAIKEQAQKAIQALKEYKEQGKKKKSLFPEIDLGVFLLVVYKKPAMYNASHNVRRLISLPQPDKNFDNTSICIVLPDLDKSDAAKKNPDVDAEAREWAVKLREEHSINKQISKVLTLRQVMRENSTPESKRKLAETYDIFLCDKRIHKSVCTFLGKSFNKARKVPIPVDLEKPLISQIQDSYGKISMPLGACRTRVSLRFGHLNQPIEDLTTNVDEVVKKVVEYCPGGMDNVRSMYVELPTGKPTLPIYVHMGSANEVKLQKAPKLRPTEGAGQTLECSTLPEGLGVQIRPNGKVRVVEEKTGKGVLYPTTRDEYQKRDDLKPKVNVKWIEKRRLEKQKKRQNRVKVLKKRKRAANAAGGQPVGKKAKKEEVKTEA